MSNSETTIDVTVTDDNMAIDIYAYDTVGSTETDHRLLTHRDSPDQHPMTAITGLATSLQTMSSVIDSRLTATENGIIVLQGDVADAATTATGYLTPVDSGSGIRLHTEDSAALDYIELNGDGMNVYKGAESVAAFGDITRVGLMNGARLTLDPSGIKGLSSNGTMYFSISEGESGVLDANMWLIDDKIIRYSPSSTKVYLADPISGDKAASAGVIANFATLATGDTFKIQIDNYVMRYHIEHEGGETYYREPTLIASNTVVVSFVKGTTDNSKASVKYNGETQELTIRTGYNPYDDTDEYYYTTYGGTVTYISLKTGRYPFYRFGTNVASSGGASAFVAGTGTKADYANQFAIGEFNSSVSNNLFEVGNGTSDSSRSNAMEVSRTGNATIAGSLTQSSDRRLKEHIGYLGEDAVNFVKALKPAHFIKNDAHHTGFYAQDVEAVDSWHAMTGEMNGFKTLGYTELIAPLVAYCQSLERRIEELEERN